ncbi:hypothetical protein D3C77_549150 [compost metagenome]
MQTRPCLAFQALLQRAKVARHRLEAVVLAITATGAQVAFKRVPIESTQVEDHLVSKIGTETRVEINLQRRGHWQQIMIQVQAPLDMVNEQLA